MEEKLGKIVVDGKLIDLDTMPLDELKKLQKEIGKKERKKREEIYEYLERDSDDEER